MIEKGAGDAKKILTVHTGRVVWEEIVGAIWTNAGG
jgi:hypothetical protein